MPNLKLLPTTDSENFFTKIYIKLMDREKCPICENHALKKTHNIQIVGDFLGKEIIKGTEYTLMCAKCDYKSDRIFTPIIKSWWKFLLGK